MRFDLDNIFGINQQALKVHARRAEILAGNLANADTPGYKAQDIDFKETLLRVKGDANGATGLNTTNSRHLTSSGSLEGSVDGVLGEMKYRVPNQASIDGNTVDELQEKSAFMENSLLYQANLEFLGDKIKSVKEALKSE